MSEEIKLRPHHFLCLRFWAGNGYSAAYTQKVEEILPQIKNGTKVEIVFGPDTLCKACPHLKKSLCDSQQRVTKFDADVVKLCGLTDGQKTTWQEMCSLVSEKVMESGQFFSICGDCAWAEYCHN